MRISYSWLKEFIELTVSPEETARLLTSLGLETKIASESVGWRGVVTARVNAVKPHPNADKLRLCSVSDGTREYPVVCGAPNVEEGQIVPLALIGAGLPGGVTIKKAKIRGVESEGMICSERELGLSAESSGIMVLPYYTPMGRPLEEIIVGPDTVLEVEITTNRPDCLSHWGVARELAAKLNAAVRLPEIRRGETPGRVKITVADGALCPRYIGCRITGVRVGPSPDWLARRLEQCGLRPINNIVDITNYVLVELGHPLHAFDAAGLEGEEIVVRRARGGEKLRALDGKEYALTDAMLVIADAAKPQAIAGVIGGEESGVTGATTDIILESALFAPSSIRKTSKAIALSTDASYRFERGTSWETAELASWRAATLIEQIAGGKLAGRSDVAAGKYSPVEITLRPSRVEHVLNLRIGDPGIRRILEALGMRVQQEGERFRVFVPPWRLDIKEEADLIEELARVQGYDDVPVTVMPVIPRLDEGKAVKSAENILRERLVGLGFCEVLNYSFTEESRLAHFHIASSYRIANPLSKENEVLRPNLLPGLWKNFIENLGQGFGDVKLFESGTVFTSDGERKSLAFLVSGNVWPEWWGWEARKTSPPRFDFYFLEGVIGNILSAIPCRVAGNAAPSPFLHPAQSARIELGGVPVGEFGMLGPEYRQGNNAEIGYAEIDLGLLEKNWTREYPAFERIDRFPPTKRDISLVADRTMPFGRIADALSEVFAKGLHVRDYELFSRYEDARLGADKVSYSLHLIFRHPERTLTDKDVNEEVEKILRHLEKKLNVSLRS